MGKLKFATKRGASCVGCEIEILNLHEKLLQLFENIEIVFGPTLVDVKYKEFKALPEKSVDIGIYHGAIRNEDNEEMAKVMREKCKVLIAFGSCACFGGIPSLANFSDARGCLNTAYREVVSVENPEGVLPSPEVIVNGKYKLTLPKLFDTVKKLDDVVKVDYYIPGCPPTHDMIHRVLDLIVHLAKGGAPPESKFPASFDKALCEECPRKDTKPEKLIIEDIKYLHEVTPDPDKCFLAQGILCMGPATRGGCGAPCINANMPCRGCCGKPDNALEQGAAMLSAFTSILVVDKEKDMTEEEIQKLIDRIKDPAGYFYRFSMADSILKRKQKDLK